MAFLMESAARCQSCGTSAWEWEEDRFAYTPVTVQCMGCYIKDVAREDDAPPGSRVTLIPKEQADKFTDRPNRLPKAGGASDV